MVSAAAVAAAVAASRAAARRREEDRRRRRREEEERRRRRAEEERRRRKDEESRRRKEEEERRRKREKETRRQQEYQRKLKRDVTSQLHQKQEASNVASSTSLSTVYEFTDVLKIERADLPIVHSGVFESILADGSRLSNMDNRYVITYPDGKVQEYDSDYYHRSLYLTREELPNGAMVVYDTKGKKLYERDEQGNYTYHKTDANSNITETVEGKISAEISKEFTDVLRIERADLPIVHRGAFESILADGSHLSNMDNRYVITYPDGKVQEYNSDYYHRSLYLTREELPNGAMVSYDTNGKKLYERDEQGNYTYHKIDSNGKITETVEGKISTEISKEFTDVLRIERADLPIVYKGAFESILADGSRLTNMDNRYVITYPDGKVQEYDSDYYHRSLYLTREELPNGAMVSYDTNGKKLYERDEQGNYTYHKIDSNGKITETVEGKISTEISKEFTDVLRIERADLPIVHRGAFESILADGSRLTNMDNRYVITYPDGKVQEYNSDYYHRSLYLTREELPNGAMVSYDTNGKKLYERDEQGNYTYHKIDSNGKITETTEVKDSKLKKTFYGKNGDVTYYIMGEEPNKKYYPSGKLFEEVKEDGSCYQYEENGFCKYEKNAKGEYFKYQPTDDGKDRLVIEKGTGDVWSEKYAYYPSGQVKEEYLGGKYGVYRNYSEKGVCLFENDGRGTISEYQLTPDGKDRLLTKKTEWNYILEQHEYYPSGKIKESKYSGGEHIRYNEDGTYQKFDKYDRLKEETTSSGKTVYAHYADTIQVEHIAKYDTEGKAIASEYKHFDKEGKEDTAYYLALKRLIARKIEKAEQKQAKKGIPPEERKVSKKMSKPEKFFAKIKAKIAGRNG